MVVGNAQVHMEVPSESGGSNITQYLIDVDTVSTFSSTTLVTHTVDSDEVRTPPAARHKNRALSCHPASC